MTHEEAFLDAILQNPEDDAPRLIYADWLEENGRGERAEFIRVQIELERLPAYDPPRRGLARREQELWEAHRRAWLPPVKGLGTFGWTFRRGFLERIPLLRVRDFLEHGPALFRRAPIRELQLLCSWDDDFPAVAASPLLARLQSLCILKEHSIWPLGTTNLATLVGSPHLQNLRALTLSSAQVGTEGVRVLTTSRLRGLRHLSLPENAIGANGVEVLAGWAGLSQLASLNMEDNTIGSAGVQALVGSPHLGPLRKLNLRKNDIERAGVRALARTPRLRSLVDLQLADNRLGDLGAEELAGSPYLRHLQSLGLAQNSLGYGAGGALGRSPSCGELRTWISTATTWATSALRGWPGRRDRQP